MDGLAFCGKFQADFDLYLSALEMPCDVFLWLHVYIYVVSLALSIYLLQCTHWTFDQYIHAILFVTVKS